MSYIGQSWSCDNCERRFISQDEVKTDIAIMNGNGSRILPMVCNRCAKAAVAALDEFKPVKVVENKNEND